MCDDFNLIDAFKVLGGTGSSGSLSKAKFAEGLGNIGIKTNKNAKAVDLLYQRYDIDINEKLTFDEFS